MKGTRVMNSNSLGVFEKIRPTLKGRRMEVYYAIKDIGRATLIDIEKYLNLRINIFSGRLTELTRLGYIKKVGDSGDFSIYSVTDKPV